MGRDRSKCSKKYRKTCKSVTSEDDDETDVATCFTSTTNTTCQKQKNCKNYRNNKSKRKCSCCSCEERRNTGRDNTPLRLRERMVAILSPAVSNKNLTNILSTDTSDIFTVTKPKPVKKCSRSSRKPIRKPCSKRSSSKHCKCRKSNCSHNPQGRNKSKPPLPPPPELPKCQVCSKVFDSPILLCCGHTFCKSCVTVFVEASDGTSFCCPVCETDIKLSGDEEEFFCPNFLLLKHLDQDDDESYDSVLCAVCTTDNEAEFYCETCQDLLCDDCADAHTVVKYTKNHSIKEINCSTDLPSLIKQKYYCTEHVNQPLDTYCGTCEKCICQICVQQLHRSNKHICMPIKTAAEKVKDEMRRQLYDFKGRSPNLQLALMDLKHAKKKLRDQANATYAEINESMVRIVTSLKEHEKRLYKKLEDVCKTKAVSLKAHKHRIVAHLEKFEALSNLLQQLNNHDNDIETLQMRATIRACADNLEDFVTNSKGVQSSVMFNSNEIKLKKELSKHGEIFHYTTNNQTQVTPEFRNVESYYIVSNFGDHVSLPSSSAPSILSDVFLRKNAKKVRAKSNWMIVKSKLPDVIRSGRSRGTYRTYHSNKSVSRAAARKTEVSRARKQKAKANWMILRSHLSDITESDQSKIAESPRYRSAIPDFSAIHAKRKMKLKAMRSRAKRQRAEANWLLVKSRLSDIVDFGHVTGRLFTPVRRKLFRKRTSPTIMKLKHFRAITLRARANWLLVASRLQDIAKYPQKIRKTRKEKNTLDSYLNELAVNRRKATRNKYVAGVLRARANWMIVRSRLPDITLYGKYQIYSRRQHSPSKPNLHRARSLDEHDGETQRKTYSKYSQAKKDEKSRKYEQITSKIPVMKSPRPTNKSKIKMAIENWHKIVQNTPNKKRSSSFKSKRNVTYKHFDTLIQGTSPKPDSTALKDWDSIVRHAPKKSENAYEHFDNLVQGTSTKPDSTALKDWDNLVRHAPKKSENAYEHFDNLVQGTSSKPDSTALKDWNSLVRHKPKHSNKSYEHFDNLLQGTSSKPESTALNDWDSIVRHTPKKSNDPYKHFDNLIHGTSSKPDSTALKNWHNLVRQASTKWSSKKNTEPLANWDSVVKNTSSRNVKRSSSLKSKTAPYNNWDILIQNTSREINNASSLRSQDAFKNWDSLLCTQISDPQKSLHNWDHLVVGTSTLSHSRRAKSEESISRYSQGEQNWYKLADDSKKEKQNADENWHHLTKNSHFDKRHAEDDWANLISYTPATKTKPGERAMKRWAKLKTSLGKSSTYDQVDASQAAPARKQEKQAYQNWWVLISGVKNSKRSSKRGGGEDIREKAVRKKDEFDREACHNWNNMIQGTNASDDTTKNQKSLEDWARLIHGTRIEQQDNKEETVSHWSNLISNTEVSATGSNEGAVADWHNLIRLVNTANSEEEIQTAVKHWHNLMYATKAVPPFDTMASLHHWGKLIEGRIIRRKASKVPSLSASASDDMLRNIQNYSSHSGGENVFKKMSGTPPAGLTLLYNKSRSSTPGYNEPKIMRLNIKDENGNFNDVKVKLTSPNKSMLSAHFKENGDGTFTIFYCPTTDDAFNITVSLQGSTLSEEIDILNFKGNFSTLKTEKDMKLACRTISLIRWQLTPGLLVRQGERILAAK